MSTDTTRDLTRRAVLANLRREPDAARLRLEALRRLAGADHPSSGTTKGEQVR